MPEIPKTRPPEPKLIAEYNPDEFLNAVVSYAPLKEVAHGIVCLSESHWG